MTPGVTVNLSWCKKCGICVYICPKDVFDIKDVLTIKNPDQCIGCLLCEIHCPDFAIKIEKGECR